MPLLHTRGGKGVTLFHPRGGRGTPVSSKVVVVVTPVCFPICTATQNSEKFESTTQVLSSVYRTGGSK